MVQSLQWWWSKHVLQLVLLCFWVAVVCFRERALTVRYSFGLEMVAHFLCGLVLPYSPVTVGESNCWLMLTSEPVESENKAEVLGYSVLWCYFSNFVSSLQFWKLSALIMLRASITQHTISVLWEGRTAVVRFMAKDSKQECITVCYSVWEGRDVSVRSLFLWLWSCVR